MNTKLISVGNGHVLVASEDFLNGYQVGHLTYMAAMKRHPEPYTDGYIVSLMLDQLEDMQLPTTYGMGFVVGWLATLTTKGIQSQATISLPVAIEGTPTEERG